MSYMASPGYSLRYGWRGREKEMNQISPLLTARDYTIDEVDELIRPQFQTMRDAIEISRKYRYDLDISTTYGLLDIVIYNKTFRYHDLTPLMPLFGRALSVSMDSFSFGRAVMLRAFYIFCDKKSST